jgi:hypothetical protein
MRRVFILVWSLLLVCSANGQVANEHELVARSVAAQRLATKFELGTTDFVDAKRQTKEGLVELGNTLVPSFIERYPRVSESQTKATVARHMLVLFEQLTQLFDETLPTALNRHANAFSESFSTDELREIRRRNPDVISEKHQKFLREVMPLLDSIPDFAFANRVQGFITTLAVIEKELASLSTAASKP